jgi:hypothetical protein
MSMVPRVASPALLAASVALGWLPSACAPSERAKADTGAAARVGDGGDPFPEDPSCAHSLTKYPGDCRAPPPLDPSEGVIAHYGPRDYDDPAQIADFVLAPGDEKVDCAYSVLSNASDLYYDRYDVWSRPGTHHIILSAAQGVADGLHDDCTQRSHASAMLAVLQGGIDGSVYHYPPSGDVAPENAHLGTGLLAGQVVVYELHAVNTTESPILRESWTAFYSMPKADVTATVGQMAFNGGLQMHIEPHSKAIIKNSCVVPQELGDVRVVDLFGHMHAHGERFSAWAVKKDVSGVETRDLIYESYDWSSLDLIEFNSVKKNPSITYAGGKPGGASGILTLSPGDRIDYECAMNNTEDYALVFAAKAFTGEMCNMFGSFTPGSYWSCLGN